MRPTSPTTAADRRWWSKSLPGAPTSHHPGRVLEHRRSPGRDAHPGRHNADRSLPRSSSPAQNDYVRYREELRSRSLIGVLTATVRGTPSSCFTLTSGSITQDSDRRGQRRRTYTFSSDAGGSPRLKTTNLTFSGLLPGSKYSIPPSWATIMLDQFSSQPVSSAMRHGF